MIHCAAGCSLGQWLPLRPWGSARIFLAVAKHANKIKQSKENVVETLGKLWWWFGKNNINTCLTAIWKIYTKRLVMLCEYTNCSSHCNTKPTVHCSVPNNDLPKSCIICSQPNKPSPGFIANFCWNCSFCFTQTLRISVLAAASFISQVCVWS